MTRSLKAVYENGVLRPLESLPFREKEGLTSAEHLPVHVPDRYVRSLPSARTLKIRPTSSGLRVYAIRTSLVRPWVKGYRRNPHFLQVWRFLDIDVTAQKAFSAAGRK